MINESAASPGALSLSCPPLPAAGQVVVLDVFTRDGRGGNPVPLVLKAEGMDDAAMRGVAAAYGHESAFVLPARDPAAQWRLRFFVPGHEMEMCGHASVGSLWALRQWGLWTTPTTTLETASGLVQAQWDEGLQCVWISQPAAQIQPLDAAQSRATADVLRLAADPARPAAINACTSRIKTLLRLPSPEALHGLQPDFTQMFALCDAIGSTGLYPYAIAAQGDAANPEDRALRVHARQFPKASGYPEDAATGIAAAALWAYLRAHAELRHADDPQAACVVLQGEAMGSPSAIRVRERRDASGQPLGCWLSGAVQWRAA